MRIKKRDDIYDVIVQGLTLLSNLKTADLENASFKRGFELLKKLSLDKLHRKDASILVMKEMVLPGLTIKKGKSTYSPYKERITKAYDKTAKSLEYANKIARERAIKHTDAEILAMRKKLEEETVLKDSSGSFIQGKVQSDHKHTTERGKKYTPEQVYRSKFKNWQNPITICQFLYTTEHTELTERGDHNLMRRMPSFNIFTLKLIRRPFL